MPKIAQLSNLKTTSPTPCALHGLERYLSLPFFFFFFLIEWEKMVGKSNVPFSIPFYQFMGKMVGTYLNTQGNYNWG
jgi:hypothetical protein